jgi:hypothetical protein
MRDKSDEAILHRKESEPLSAWLCPYYPTSTSSDEKEPTVVCDTHFFVVQ